MLVAMDSITEMTVSTFESLFMLRSNLSFYVINMFNNVLSIKLQQQQRFEAKISFRLTSWTLPVMIYFF